MIEKIKFGFRMLKFTPNKKGMIISGSIFVVLGMVYGVLLASTSPDGFISFISLYFLAMPALMFYQNLPTCAFSGLVASSEISRHFVTDNLIIMEGCFSILNYALIVLWVGLGSLFGIYSTEDVGFLLLMAGCLFGLFIIYNTACYKAFLVFTICFLITILGMFACVVMHGKGNSLQMLSVSTPVGILCGILAICISSGIAYGISLLLYRRPLDKRAMANAIKTEI